MLDDLPANARVLVAVLPLARDLAIAREQGWYRVPLGRAPRTVAAEALAFYQPSVFGTERWAVRWVALVRRVRLATRRELLPDEAVHPRAGERYLCFELGSLEALPVPIPSAKLRRITFIPTTLGQLLRANDVCELWQTAQDTQFDDELWGAGIAGKPLRR